MDAEGRIITLRFDDFFVLRSTRNAGDVNDIKIR